MGEEGEGRGHAQTHTHALLRIFVHCVFFMFVATTSLLTCPTPPTSSPPLPSPPLPSSPLHRFYGSRFDDIFNIVPVGNSFNDSLNATAVGCRSHLTLCLWAKSWWCLHGRGQHIPWAVCLCFLQQITISYVPHRSPNFLTLHPHLIPRPPYLSLAFYISPQNIISLC